MGEATLHTSLVLKTEMKKENKIKNGRQASNKIRGSCKKKGNSPQEAITEEE